MSAMTIRFGEYVRPALGATKKKFWSSQLMTSQGASGTSSSEAFWLHAVNRTSRASRCMARSFIKKRAAVILLAYAPRSGDEDEDQDNRVAACALLVVPCTGFRNRSDV